MNELIIGYGEIGQAVKEAVCPEAYCHDPQQDIHFEPGEPITVMHICFGHSDTFVESALAYIEGYRPQHVFVWSTVPIGTTRHFGHGAIHTPVEGKHPKLAVSMRSFPRWIGANSVAAKKFAESYFSEKRLNIRVAHSSEATEAMKMLSTTEYGINIAFADYKKQIADTLGFDYAHYKMWNEDYNDLYQYLGMPQFQKFVLDPPNGVVGGHCVRENSILLNEQFPNTMVEIVANMKKPKEQES